MSNRARLALLLVVLSAATAARAEKLDVRRRYEEALVQAALLRTGLVADPQPDGKIIERIVIVANDVILPGDYGIPYKIPIVHPLLSHVTWLNKVHVRTRDYIIRQEMLFHVGDHLQRDLVDETGRNLRAFFILAVARIVVTRGSTPNSVVVLVVTKDQWTLRLNTDFTIDQARLDTLSMSISESNLAGRNKTASIQYALDPGRHTVGLGYLDPRIGGSRHQLTLLADIFLNRETGLIEGGLGQLTVGRPLYSLRTKWGWQLDLSYLQDIARTFQGAVLHEYKFKDELIPDAYAERVITGNLVGTRSFGVLDKLNLSVGFRVTAARYGLPDNFPPSLSTGARNAYLAILPRSESASGPFLSATAFRASYVRLQNINTFALSEDFRLGPTASIELRFADPIFGFDSRYTTVTASYGATYYAHDNLVSMSASGTARLQAGVLANQSWLNETVTGAFHEITPRFGPFRLHIAGSAQIRHNDLTNARLTLGSDSGLRGFGPRTFLGNDFYLVNVELRSIALNLWTVHVGVVVFYDGGDAPASLYLASWHQDAGFGLRVLFPQFNKDVLRFDLAFPFERTAGIFAPRFSVSFAQAF